MKKQAIFLMLVIIIVFNNYSFAQDKKEPWLESQLMQPSDLAKIILDKDSKQPVIFSIGYDAFIKGSIVIGAATKQTNLDKLQKELSKLSTEDSVIIYCGCCPFENCPNIRPAFQLLNKLKFVNAKLLNLPDNIKVDWINKGYPINEKK
jgi:hypothetical protein